MGHITCTISRNTEHNALGLLAIINNNIFMLSLISPIAEIIIKVKPNHLTGQNSVLELKIVKILAFDEF